MLSFIRFLAWCFMTAAMVIAGIAGAGYWLYRDAESPGPLAEARTLLIPPHTGIAGIAELLGEEGVIRHPLTFQIFAKLSGRGAVLKPGEYEIPAGASTMQTLDLLASGKMVKHRLTIPEGLTSAEIVALVQGAPALDGDVGAPPREGELLPDTYVYTYGETRKEIIERMKKAMAHTLAQLWKDRRPDPALPTAEDAVTLASIVEKETAREEERPHIAGVFMNRLRLGMRLQADPTVAFALAGESGAGKLDRPVNHADLAVNSPYNTYLNKGLPPGPIGNPGKASLRAVMRPERTEDLYFVADGSGGHVFAKTLADHRGNIAQGRHPNGPEAEAPAPPPLSPAAAPLDDAVPPPAPAASKPDDAPPRPAAKPAVQTGAKAASAAAHHAAADKQAARDRRCHAEPGRPCSQH